MSFYKSVNLNFHKKMSQSGRCGQVQVSILARFRWPLVVADRWSLFRGSFSTKIARAGFRVVVVDRCSLFGGGRQHRFDCIMIFIQVRHPQGLNQTFSDYRKFLLQDWLLKKIAEFRKQRSFFQFLCQSFSSFTNKLENI